jgi:hypothetical protein
VRSALRRAAERSGTGPSDEDGGLNRLS